MPWTNPNPFAPLAPQAVQPAAPKVVALSASSPDPLYVGDGSLVAVVDLSAPAQPTACTVLISLTCRMTLDAQTTVAFQAVVSGTELAPQLHSQPDTASPGVSGLSPLCVSYAASTVLPADTAMVLRITAQSSPGGGDTSVCSAVTTALLVPV